VSAGEARVTKASISRAWDETKQIVGRDSRLFVAVGLALFVLPGTLAGVINPSMLLGTPPTETGYALLWLAVLIIGLVGRLAAARLAFGSTSVAQAIREGASRAPVALGAMLIFAIPVVLLLMPILPRLLASPEEPDGAAALALLAIMLAALFFFVRLLFLVIPIVIAEKGNPVGLLKRNWQLTRGNLWRLIGFFLLYLIASGIVGQVVQMIVGSIIRLVGGAIEPMSVGALILGLAISIVGAVFAVLFTVMLTRIYVQLAGSAEAAASVPSTSD
jgi:hypothetical protein